MWKLMSIMLCAISLFSECTAVPSIKPQSLRGIIFPAVDQYNECFVDEAHQVKGTCKNLSDCPQALERWKTENIHPQTCYFNKFDQIVCCEIERYSRPEPQVYTPPVMDVQRRSETECGSYYFFKTTIVHGEPTKPKEFPYMAALGWKSNFDNVINYRCGGALISKNFVLTAAHCAVMGGDLPGVVRIGGVNLTDSSVDDIKVKRVIVHPDYNVNSLYNDIALVQLEKETSETPVCVWSQNIFDHSNVTAIGYGHTRFAGSSTDQLLKANLFLVANDVCQNYYTNDQTLLRKGIASTHVCAGDPEQLRDTCQGDSGGPIIMKVERDTDRSYVVGITSFGQGCAGEPPSIYTRTSAYIDWIENIVWSETAK